ncbi:hypothetical protein GOE21_07045 [Escherichia coli]|nr:hypothetical protein AW120_12685 [Escherichia coli]QRE92408.1 hypothetical protein GOE21_07045 [Escherichia coli]
MKIEYAPERGRGFVRPGESEKPCYRVFSGIKKAAPIWSRLSEQLTCCEKIGLVQGNYTNCVKKCHNCQFSFAANASIKNIHSLNSVCVFVRSCSRLFVKKRSGAYAPLRSLFS